MKLKCDRSLDWWIRLANLHAAVLSLGSDSPVPNQGFADKVRRLEGPPPEGIDVLLNPQDPLRDWLIAFGNERDQCLWGLAGVANSLLSKLSGLRNAKNPPQEIIVADWSKFTAPLLVSVSPSGTIEKAYRPEPLADDLLPLLRGKNVSRVGTCPICGRLFQRLRRDQQCDNRRCRDTYRQRRFRAKRGRRSRSRRRRGARRAQRHR